MALVSSTLTSVRDPLELLPPEALPNVDEITIEDDTPVDNILSEKHQRLLTESLYASWAGPGEKRPFLVAANVGLFFSVYEPPIVPDVFLSLDVKPAESLREKRHRTYFFWEFGKPPEVVIEIVSNQKGNEATEKLKDYARLGIAYYVIFDPLKQIGEDVLRVYGLNHDKRYRLIPPQELPGVGLGLTLWRGVYEGQEDEWLRWCDPEGNLILTGAERADQERQRADQERQRAESLAAQLRALGVKPEGK
jgi:Uma2 family endonuclease